MNYSVRSLVVPAILLSLCAATARASLLQVSLQVYPAPTDPQLWDVAIYARCDTGRPAVGDGGIAGLQFDILSAGSELSAPLPASVGLPGGYVSTTFAPAIQLNFITALPRRVDASAVYGYAADTDSDLDAIGGVFSDSNHQASLTDFGTHGSWELVATEHWRVTYPSIGDTFTVSVVAAQYYDFDNPSGNYRTSFTDVVAFGSPPWIPEPNPTVTALAALMVFAATRPRCCRHSTD